MNYERMTKQELIVALKSLQPDQDPLEQKRLLHDLQVHQLELEMQNRELQEAQQQLEESRNRYAELYDFAPVGYATLDGNGLIKEINLTGARLLGMERARLIGMPFTTVVDKSDRPLFRDHLLQCKQANAGLYTKLSLTGEDRESKVVQLLSIPVQKTGHNSILYRTAITDITERNQREKELQKKREREQQYLDLVEVMLVAVNERGEITLINRKGCEILGYEETELLGKNWFRTCLPAATRAEARQIFENLMKGKPAANNYYEKPVLTKSGSEEVVAWHHCLLKDEAGNGSGILSSGQNVTLQLRTLEALGESEARLRAIVDTAASGIVTTNDQGIIKFVNATLERLFGYLATEMMGQNISMLMPSPHQEQHETYISQYLRTGEKKIIGLGREVIGQRKDGSTFPVNLSVSEFFLGDRRMFAGIVRDVTKQKALQKRILQFERLAVIGKMAAKVAHEVRNPLSSISLNVELLEEEVGSYKSDKTDEAKFLLKAITQEIDRVSRLTTEYLQFTRLPESRPGRANPKDLIIETVGFLRSELDKKNIEFEFKESKQAYEIRVDQLQFGRVILNLIRNAIEAMPKGGKLLAWTEKTGQTGVIYIKDTGHGIPADKVSSIFDPFFTTKDFGTGLGLAITQQIIHENGGQIHCESEIGQGTTFRLEIPLDGKE